MGVADEELALRVPAVVVSLGCHCPRQSSPSRAAGRAGSIPCGHSSPGCPCRPVRKAEEKSRTSVCPGFLPAPAKGRGSTDAAGGGHLLWKGTEILCRESASSEPVWKAWLEEMRLAEAEVSTACLPSDGPSWPRMLEITFEPGHFSISIQSVQQHATLKSRNVTFPGPVL